MTLQSKLIISSMLSNSQLADYPFSLFEPYVSHWIKPRQLLRKAMLKAIPGYTRPSPCRFRITCFESPFSMISEYHYRNSILHTTRIDRLIDLIFYDFKLLILWFTTDHLFCFSRANINSSNSSEFLRHAHQESIRPFSRLISI